MSDQTATFQQAVILPLSQSMITGVLCGVVSGSLAALAGISSPVTIGLGAAGVVSCASWLSYRAEWRKRVNALAGIHEELEAKRMEASTIRVEVISEDGRAGDYLALPGGRERLAELAKGLSEGRPLTCRQWSRLYSPSEFDQLRSELIARGYADWKGHDHRSGVEVTRPGLAVMRYLAQDPPPSPGLQGLQIIHSPRKKTDTHTNTRGLL